jgi:hypothetical protein
LNTLVAVAVMTFVGTSIGWQRESLPGTVAENRPGIAIHAAGGEIWAAWMGKHDVHLLRRSPGKGWNEAGKVSVRGEYPLNLVMNVSGDVILLAYESRFDAGPVTSILRWREGRLEYVGPPLRSGGGALHVSLAAGRSDNELYAAWDEVGSVDTTRAVRWRDGRWEDFGPEVHVKYGGNTSLGLDRDHHPWLAWNDADRTRKKMSLQVARYDGNNWQAVAVPPGLVDEALSPDILRVHGFPDGSISIVLSQARQKSPTGPVPMFVTNVLNWSPRGWIREAFPITASRESMLIDSKVVDGKLVLAWFSPHAGPNTKVDTAFRDSDHWTLCPPLMSDLPVVRAYIVGNGRSELALAVDNLAEGKEIGSLATINACK